MGPVFRAAGLLAATTIGAGMFALPHVFTEAGRAAGVFYLALLTGIIVFAHGLYARVIEGGGTGYLTALVRSALGVGPALIGFVAVAGGLVLTLVLYLILGGTFFSALIPQFSWGTGVFLLWAAGTLPLVFRLRTLVGTEVVGALAMAAIIVWIAASAGGMSRPDLPGNPQQFFLPFGPVLFSLAAWTAVEPAVAFLGRRGRGRVLVSLALGSGVSAALYWLFAEGILSSAPFITPDTISGLAAWPAVKRSALAALGLLAIWTSYIPIAREIEGSFRKRPVGIFCAVLLPPMLVAIGLNNFLTVIELAGGVFLATQYVFIMLIARKKLALPPLQALAADAVIVAFTLAAFVEVERFILQ